MIALCVLHIHTKQTFKSEYYYHDNIVTMDYDITERENDRFDTGMCI